MSPESGQERRTTIIELTALKRFWRHLSTHLDDQELERLMALQDEFVEVTQRFVLDALKTDNQEEMRSLLLESHRWHVVTGSGPDAPEAVLSEEEDVIRREVDKRVTDFVSQLRQEFNLDF